MNRTLDRLVSFDPKSRSFPIRMLVASLKPRSYTWARGDDPAWPGGGDLVLDQGQEGACVGFGISGELAARPVIVKGIDDAFAFGLYHEAQTLDEWPGEDYSGTSVLAGMKAAQRRGFFREYRWAFGLDDLIMAVGHAGPAVLGVNWRDDMWDPDADGTLHVSGSVAGGHCLYVRGVNVRLRKFRLTNSWGPSWGYGGDAFVSFEDMAKLLDDDGEAAIPIGRMRP